MLERKVDRSAESSGEEVSVKVGSEPCLRRDGVEENCRWVFAFDGEEMVRRQERQTENDAGEGMVGRLCCSEDINEGSLFVLSQ